MMPPVHLMGWIQENRHLLKPPVGNRQIWSNREFMVTVVGGPNARSDYHINEGEEFFFQLEGTLVLRILEVGGPREQRVAPGEIFLLPPNVPHSPQRPAGSVGLVIERRRLPHERDTFLWICDHCQARLYEESFHLTDIVAQLPPVFERYHANAKHFTCQRCGHTHARPAL